jgi:hypothetical protein
MRVAGGKKRGACRHRQTPRTPLKRRSSAGFGGAFFFFYPIYSEYQVERINRPNIFEVIKTEVSCYEGLLLWIFEVPLDKFSTFGGLGEIFGNLGGFGSYAGTESWHSTSANTGQVWAAGRLTHRAGRVSLAQGDQRERRNSLKSAARGEALPTFAGSMRVKRAKACLVLWYGPLLLIARVAFTNDGSRSSFRIGSI